MTSRWRTLLLAGGIGLAALVLTFIPARRPPSPAPPSVGVAAATSREGGSLPTGPDTVRRREQRRRGSLPWGRDPFADHGAHSDR